MVLKQTVATEKQVWISTYRAARRLWPGASDYGLDDLISLRGLDIRIEALGSEQPPVRATTKARLTRLLLIELLKQATVKQLVSFSNLKAPPPRAPPLPHDDPAWSFVPDDDLRWWATEATNLPAHVHLRARAERSLRAEASRQSRET
jgi:DNA polymerase III epsilon subunit-like protein